MHKITFYIGLQQSDGRPVEDGKENVHIGQFCVALAGSFGGCTMWQTDGMWQNTETDELVIESSLVVETIMTDEDWEGCKEHILDMVSLLKTAIDQDTVLYTRQELQEMSIE